MPVMPPRQHTPEEVQHRLACLWAKLESEGQYVGANTVGLAMELITQLSGVPHADALQLEELVRGRDGA